jgi:hypothetical protein
MMNGEEESGEKRSSEEKYGSIFEGREGRYHMIQIKNRNRGRKTQCIPSPPGPSCCSF